MAFQMAKRLVAIPQNYLRTARVFFLRRHTDPWRDARLTNKRFSRTTPSRQFGFELPSHPYNQDKSTWWRRWKYSTESPRGGVPNKAADVRLAWGRVELVNDTNVDEPANYEAEARRHFHVGGNIKKAGSSSFLATFCLSRQSRLSVVRQAAFL